MGGQAGAVGPSTGLGLTLALSNANSGVVALFDALNVVYNEETRSTLRLYAITFGFTLAGVGFTILALGGVVALPILLRFLGLPSLTEWLLAAARWPVLLLTVLGASP